MPKYFTCVLHDLHIFFTWFTLEVMCEWFWISPKCFFKFNNEKRHITKVHVDSSFDKAADKNALSKFIVLEKKDKGKN